jgi:hypothetical protein
MIPDLTGERFGRVTVIGPDPGYPSLWLVECACGRQLSCPREALTAGRVTSCGRPLAGTAAAEQARQAEMNPRRPPWQ